MTKQYNGMDNNRQPVSNIEQAKLGHFQEKHLANESKMIVKIEKQLYKSNKYILMQTKQISYSMETDGKETKFQQFF